MRGRVICAPSSWQEISSAPSVVVMRGGWRSGPRPGTCAMNADRRSCGLAPRWSAADGEGDRRGVTLVVPEEGQVEDLGAGDGGSRSECGVRGGVAVALTRELTSRCTGAGEPDTCAFGNRGIAGGGRIGRVRSLRGPVVGPATVTSRPDGPAAGRDQPGPGGSPPGDR